MLLRFAIVALHDLAIAVPGISLSVALSGQKGIRHESRTCASVLLPESSSGPSGQTSPSVFGLSVLEVGLFQLVSRRQCGNINIELISLVVVVRVRAETVVVVVVCVVAAAASRAARGGV